MNPEPSAKDRARLREQSNRIAEMLTAAGVAGTREDASAIYTKWLGRERPDSLPAFRHITLIPEVSAAVRGPKLAALGYWLQRHPHARCFILTTGGRYPINELRAHLVTISDRLRELNRTFRAQGAELVFRATEIGTPEPDPAGRPLFSPRWLCLASPGSAPRSLAQWGELCADANAAVHGIPGAAFEFLTKAPNASDFPRYFAPPAALISLGQDNLAHLFKATYRVKLFHPLGTLADEIRTRRDRGRCLRLVKKGKGSVWKETHSYSPTNYGTEGTK